MSKVVIRVKRVTPMQHDPTYFREPYIFLRRPARVTLILCLNALLLIKTQPSHSGRSVPYV